MFSYYRKLKNSMHYHCVHDSALFYTFPQCLFVSTISPPFRGIFYNLTWLNPRENQVVEVVEAVSRFFSIRLFPVNGFIGITFCLSPGRLWAWWCNSSMGRGLSLGVPTGGACTPGTTAHAGCHVFRFCCSSFLAFLSCSELPYRFGDLCRSF